MQNLLIGFIICSHYILIQSKFLKDTPFTHAVCPKDFSILCSIFGIESAEIRVIIKSGVESGVKI